MKWHVVLTACSIVALLVAACGGGTSGDDATPEFDPTPAAWFGASAPRSFDVIYTLTDDGLKGEHELRWARGDNYSERIDTLTVIDELILGSTEIGGVWIAESACMWTSRDGLAFDVSCSGVTPVYADILRAIFDSDPAVRSDGTEEVFGAELPCYAGAGGGRASYWQADFRVCLSAEGIPLFIEAGADSAGGQGVKLRLVAKSSTLEPVDGWDRQVVVTASPRRQDGLPIESLRLPDLPLLQEYQ